MTKRPSVMSLDDLMGPKVELEPIAKPVPPPVKPEPQPEPDPVKTTNAPALPTEMSAAEVPAEKGARAFRTSLYFHRSVHDVLRDIAHAERKNVSDLINEGLDHVLTKRKLPTTTELRNGTKAS